MFVTKCLFCIVKKTPTDAFCNVKLTFGEGRAWDEGLIGYAR